MHKELMSNFDYIVLKCKYANYIVLHYIRKIFSHIPLWYCECIKYSNFKIFVHYTNLWWKQKIWYENFYLFAIIIQI
jgi:hypothetical protein